MHRTILIPTDFSISSLSLLKIAREKHDKENPDIIFVHGYCTSNSVSDLLFHSPAPFVSGKESIAALFIS